MGEEKRINPEEETTELTPTVVENTTADDDELLEGDIVDSENEPELLTPFQAKIARLSDNTWKICQGIGGVLLAVAVTAFLFGGVSEDKSSSMFTIYAALLALIVPRLVEKSCHRSINFGRMVMLITLCVGIVGFIVYSGFQNNWQFFNR